MKRREFIALLGGAAAWPLAGHAQSQPASLRVGTASPTPRRAKTSILIPFEQRMAELGYVEGKNFSLEFIDLSGPPAYGEAMRELVERKADILLAYGPEASLKAALAVTHTIPIVMVAIDYDPLALGYITSLARPTGNVTGIFFEQIELAAKRIELLKEAFPATRAATVFWDALSSDQWKVTRDSGARHGVDIAGIELKNFPYDYDAALDEVPATHRSFLIVMTSPYFAQDREKPVQAPTRLELAINLKTASALGLEVPPSLLARADEVIE